MRFITNLFKKSPWLMGIATFLLVTLSLLPTLSEWGLSYWISKETQATAKIENIDFNLFTGRFAIENLSVDKDSESLKIEQFSANVSILSLFQKKFLLDKVTLKGVNLPIKIDSASSQITIAGFQIPNSAATEAQEDPKTDATIDYGIQALTLADINLQLDLDQETIQYQIDKLHLNHLQSWSTKFARLRLSSLLNQQPVDANLQLHLFAKTPKVVGTINIEALELQGLNSQLPANISHLSGLLNLNSTFTLEQEINGLKLYQYSEIDLQDFTMSMPEQTLSNQTFSWKGNSHLFLGTSQGLKLSGELATDKLFFKKTTKTASQSLGFDLNSQLDLTAQLDTGDLALHQQGGINLTNISLSQNQQSFQAKELSYQGDFAWQQAAQTLKAQGKVTLADSQIEDPLQSLLAKTSAQLDLDLTANLASEAMQLEQKGALKLSDISITQAAQTLNAQAIDYQGHFFWNQAKQTLQAQGDLALRNTGFANKDQQLTSSALATIDLAFQQTSKGFTVSQNGPLRFDQLQLSTPEFKQTIEQIAWQGELQLTQTLPAAKSNKSAAQTALQVIHAKGDLQLNQSMSEHKPSQSKLTQNFNSQLDLTGRLSPQTLLIDLQSNSTLKNLRANNPELQLTLNELAWQDETSVNIATQTSEDNAIKLSSKLGLSLDRLDLSATAQHPMVSQPASIIKLRNVAFEKIEIPNLQQFIFEQIKLADLKVNDIQTSKPLVSLGGFKLDKQNLTLQPKTSIKLGNLILEDLTTQLHLDQDRSIVQLANLQQSLMPTHEFQEVQEVNEPPTAANEPDQQTSIEFAIQSLKLHGKNRVDLSLQEGDQTIVQNIAINKLTLGKFSTELPKVATAYELDATINDFSSIRSTGTVAPLADPIEIETQTNIDGLSLLDYSPLVNNAVGYKINSGQLSAKINGSIKQQIVDFSNEIQLAKFNLEKASNEKSAEFDKNFQMPLNVGLSLLKDKKDNIDLKLPIKGDLSNPNFNPSDVIGTALNGALGKASRAYLLVALQPFGALALAGEFALDQMSAVRFEPVTFSPAKAELDGKMQTYLKKVATLLADKSSLQIKLCHGATTQDRVALKALQPKLSTAASPDKSKSSSDSESQKVKAQQNKQLTQQLLALAKQRQNLIKKSLIEQGVKGSQVILCQPKVLEENTAPKIDMGI